MTLVLVIVKRGHTADINQRGGTFTDCIGIRQSGGDDIVIKLLSEDPRNYVDAPTEGIRRILEIFTGNTIPRHEKLDYTRIGVIRMGT